ncbi:DNA-binding GntR family transcriptional regulator [Bradyrhizobium sp. GM7.3]
MLYEEVVGRIRAILLDGEIPPGARIPERELCERLQISRTPLREALKVLAAEGLVQLLPHRGSRAAKLTDKDMRDLFEVCQGLEALAGELACERITDAEIDAIAAAHADMVRHYRERDLIQYYRGNRAIHEAIVVAAGNPVLAGLYTSVTARIRRARYVTPMTPERWAVAVKEHDAILNALQRRDGVGLAPYPASAFAPQARRGFAGGLCRNGRERARAENCVSHRFATYKESCGHAGSGGQQTQSRHNH